MASSVHSPQVRIRKGTFRPAEPGRHRVVAVLPAVLRLSELRDMGGDEQPRTQSLRQPLDRRGRGARLGARRVRARPGGRPGPARGQRTACGRGRPGAARWRRRAALRTRAARHARRGRASARARWARTSIGRPPGSSKVAHGARRPSPGSRPRWSAPHLLGHDDRFRRPRRAARAPRRGRGGREGAGSRAARPGDSARPRTTSSAIGQLTPHTCRPVTTSIPTGAAAERTTTPQL